MSPDRTSRLQVIAGTAAIALLLFVFGLGYPPQDRLRGDAAAYLLIANQFDGLASVLGYAGERTVGFPLFEFAIRTLVATFGAYDNALLWVNAICFTLLLIHVVTAWFFSSWALRTRLITSERGAHFLFFFLATYPALVGHTTSPLSDTLATDLVLCAIVALEGSLVASRLFATSWRSGLAGLLFGYSILVRPGSMLAVAAALATGLVIALLGNARRAAVVGGTFIVCAMTLAPFAYNCTQKYERVCLQSPATFDVILSAQWGLRGARTLWAKATLVPGQGPILRDELMYSDYYRRCRLDAIVGVDETSLVGCLISRPLSIPAYVVKKWVGLFDHFRFTPYLEEDTPSWLRWLSRAYDSLSWIGFALTFWVLFQALRRPTRSAVKRWVLANLTPMLLVVYSVVMLAQHTVLHVEDRYGFPVLPLCATVLVMFGERIRQSYRSDGWRGIGPVVAYCGIAWGLFVVQIVLWDRAPFT